MTAPTKGRFFDFNSQMRIGESFDDFSQEEIKNEPMLFNCDLHHSYGLGGPITKSFLSALARECDQFDGAVMDSRVHMLMPGWFPCIPGWHHDDVPRSRSDGQPNYHDPEYRTNHVMGLVNGDICPTQFAVGHCRVPDVPVGGVIYKEWHPLIQTMTDCDALILRGAPSNRLVWFDDHAFHQGQRAIKGGWRWFGRVTFGSHRKPTNELRRQVQVYLEFPMEGW